MSSATLSERIRFAEESFPAGRDILALLSQQIETGTDEELFRINPLAWAEAHGTEPDTTVDTFLHCAKAGILDLLWGALCTSCGMLLTSRGGLRSFSQKQRHCRL